MNANEQKTILLVEAEAIIANSESSVIRGFGYNAVIADSGEKAVGLAAGKAGINLVLMEIDLGNGIDGLEAARRILAARNIPIVFLTSHSEPEILEKMRDITRYGYIIKNSGDLILRSSIEMAFELFEAHEKIKNELNERRRAEDALRKINDLFTQFILHSPIYLYVKEVTPARSLVLLASDNFKDMIGIKGSEMTGKDMSEMFSAEFAEKMTADDWAVVSSGNVLKIDEEMNGRSYTSIKFPIIQGDKKLLAGYTIDITERKLAEEKIKTLLAEKELVLKEVHHRVKNNMNTVANLLLLQSSTLKEPAAVRALRDARSRVLSMMVLYDKLYRSVDFQKISIKEYLSPLVDEIVGNFPNSTMVKIEKYIDDFLLDSKKSQPLGIIINEVLTNIMKYAFTGRDEGLITVSAAAAGSRATIIIADNGNGIPESVDIESSGGFGLQLVGMLAKQLCGDIRIERMSGTKFVLEFEL